MITYTDGRAVLRPAATSINKDADNGQCGRIPGYAGCHGYRQVSVTGLVVNQVNLSDESEIFSFKSENDHFSNFLCFNMATIGCSQKLRLANKKQNNEICYSFCRLFATLLKAKKNMLGQNMQTHCCSLYVCSDPVPMVGQQKINQHPCPTLPQ
jgi:hypothetical protein